MTQRYVLNLHGSENNAFLGRYFQSAVTNTLNPQKMAAGQVLCYCLFSVASEGAKNVHLPLSVYIAFVFSDLK